MDKPTPQSDPAALPAFATLADNKHVRNGVFVGSALVALATAAGSIWQEFYNEVKHNAPFNALRKKRNEMKDIVRMEGENRNWSPERVKENVRAIEKHYSKSFNEALGRQGISTKPLRGTFDRLMELGTFDRLNIAMKTGASLAVTLGGYYLVNQNVRMRANNKHQDEQLRRLGSRIDAQTDRQVALYERASALADKDAGASVSR